MNKKYPFTQNRELSWLRFNERVLEEAADPRVPLLERLKFIAIFTSNLDEFYMIRCGSLYDLSLIDKDDIDKRSGMTPDEQLDAIYEMSEKLYVLKDETYKDINRTLRSLQMSCLSFKDLSKKQLKYVTQYFDTQIFPLLSPQIIDARHPFPHLINKGLYIIVELEQGYGIISVPNFIDRVLYVPDTEHCYLLAEQIICHFAQKLFNEKVLFKTVIRVTRNADINLDDKAIDDDEDYRQSMKKILKSRSRLSPIRLEFYKDIKDDVCEYLCDHLNLKRKQVFVSKTPLEMEHVYSVIDSASLSLKTPLSYEDFNAQPSIDLDSKKPLIPQIIDHDALLFYPYQDVGVFIDLLKEASSDPNVVSIKITIYRLAKHSKILRYLCRAAENGKEVTVLMELRARFDEQNNINAAEILEDAGCRILYGFENYKVHSKVCLITYKTRNTIKYITQIGTGNYNEKTSHMYTDISYITAKESIGKDAVAFFQNMATSNLNGSYQHLWVAPANLKQEVLPNIDLLIEHAKAGKAASIKIKMNSMTDMDIMKRLVEASQAGVKITMVIRGICCLLPELEGYTDNIWIISIVGRFLEHSRIYCFETQGVNKVYISSADFMTRNTEKRVEVACPIYDERLKKRILDYFDDILKDNVKARYLKSNGQYVRVDSSRDPYDSQKMNMEKAIELVSNKEEKVENGLFDILTRLKQSIFKK